MLFGHGRDVKPENIVLEGGKAGGRVYLVDFGGVQAATLHNDYASTIIGRRPPQHLEMTLLLYLYVAGRLRPLV